MINNHWLILVAYRQILLVGEDKEKSIPQLILVEHALKLFASLGNTVTIVGVDDENDALGVLEVMSPEGADLVLSTDIPHGELNVGILDGLDVEAYIRESVSFDVVMGLDMFGDARTLEMGWMV